MPNYDNSPPRQDTKQTLDCIYVSTRAHLLDNTMQPTVFASSAVFMPTYRGPNDNIYKREPNQKVKESVRAGRGSDCGGGSVDNNNSTRTRPTQTSSHSAVNKDEFTGAVAPRSSFDELNTGGHSKLTSTKYRQGFDMSDQNKDGHITKFEFNGGYGVPYTLINKDGNGKISCVRANSCTHQLHCHKPARVKHIQNQTENNGAPQPK